MHGATMATLIIRHLDQTSQTALQIMAARKGRTMEEEARLILMQTTCPESGEMGFGSRIHARFAAMGGVHLKYPTRSAARMIPNFSDEDPL